MLNRLNPMRDLGDLGRAQLVERYNQMRPAFEHKDPRLGLMDFQGVQAAVVHAGGAPSDSAFNRGDVEAGYAVTRAFNQWLDDDWGFAYENRIFVPVVIPLREVDHAVAELEWAIDRGAKLINLAPGPGLRPLALRPLLRPVLGPGQRGRPPGCRPPGRRRLPAPRGRLGRGPRGQVLRVQRLPVGLATGRTGRSWRPSPP